MKFTDRVLAAMSPDDRTWARHANPWSVWTRFAAIPLVVLAIWSRAWIGWWALLSVAAVAVWLWANPRVFPAVHTPTAWSSKGIFGEQRWARDRTAMPAGFGFAQRCWLVGGLTGAGLLGWGLVSYRIWPTVFGATLIGYGQLWRIDRLAIFYDAEVHDAEVHDTEVHDTGVHEAGCHGTGSDDAGSHDAGESAR